MTKSFKNVFLFFFIVILIVFFSLPPVWRYIYEFFPEEKTEYSLLRFRSLFGNYEIFVDNTKLGEVNDKDTTTFNKIESGIRKVKIIRKSNVANFYYTLEKDLYFMPDAQIDIKWEAGPSIDSSNGVITYFDNVNDVSEGTEIWVMPFPLDSKIKFNDIISNNGRKIIKNEELIKVKIENTELYEIQEFDIMLSSVKPNVRNIIEVYLYKKPFLDDI